MIEERARVLSVEQGAVWVETVRRSACDSCQARSGCGQSVLQRLGYGARQGFVRVLSAGSSCRAGDEVIIGIPEHAVVRGSALVYLAPILALFAGSLAARFSGAAEPWVILAGLSGLGIGFAAVRWRSRRWEHDPAFVPKVLRRLAGGAGVVSDIREGSG